MLVVYFSLLRISFTSILISAIFLLISSNWTAWTFSCVSKAAFTVSALSVAVAESANALKLELMERQTRTMRPTTLVIVRPNPHFIVLHFSEVFTDGEQFRFVIQLSCSHRLAFL